MWSELWLEGRRVGCEFECNYACRLLYICGWDWERGISHPPSPPPLHPLPPLPLPSPSPPQKKEAEEVREHCDTLSNILMAEFDHISNAMTSDIQSITTKFLRLQADFHSKVLWRERRGRREGGGRERGGGRRGGGREGRSSTSCISAF